jgi:hypothetical protein
MNADGTSTRRLTRTKAYEASLAFAPGGRIVFARLATENDDHELWTIDPTTGEERQHTHNDYWDLTPNWRSAGLRSLVPR